METKTTKIGMVGIPIETPHCKERDGKVVCEVKSRIPKKISWAGQIIIFKNKKEAIDWNAKFLALVLSGATSPDSVTVLEYFEE